MAASERIEALRDVFTRYVSPSKFDELVAAVRADERERVEKRFADVLGSDERGDDLIDVARLSHRAERELAGRLIAAATV